MSRHAFDFYPTPQVFTRWLLHAVDIQGTCLDPCVGAGDIPAADVDRVGRTWTGNDLDPRWAEYSDFGQQDARTWEFRLYTEAELVPFDWWITNPPFEHAFELLKNGYGQVSRGIALYLRLSFLEPLKGTQGKPDEKTAWLANCPPTYILPLPRFAHRRNDKGKWGCDNIASAWLVWDKTTEPTAWTAITYPPPDLYLALKLETPAYRARVDQLTGWKAA